MDNDGIQKLQIVKGKGSNISWQVCGAAQALSERWSGVLFNLRLKLFPIKLKLRWYMPFTITQMFHYGTVESTHMVKGTIKDNGYQFKQYLRGEFRQKDEDMLHIF